MQKTQINLDIILPELPDEKDACVQRIIQYTESRRGIQKVHVIPAGGDKAARLCFHYEPAIISINEIEQLAKKAGAAITEQYGHLLIEVKGIRHTRHARFVETSLQKHHGIQSVAVSGTGFIQLEFNRKAISQTNILQLVKKTGLALIHVEDFHTNQQVKEAPVKDDTYGKEHGYTEKEKHTADEETHEHAHGIFGDRSELVFAIISGALLGMGFGLSFINSVSAYVPLGFYIGACFFGGFYTAKEAIASIAKAHFEIDFLMLVAAVGAAALGQWVEGALLLFLFSLGHSLEHFAMGKAKKSIAALTELAPKTALLKAGNDIKEVSIEDLKKGDTILVKPNSKIPADGIVVHGSSSVNQAPITGESVPVDKVAVEEAAFDMSKADKLDAQYKVFAGSINGGENLEVKVTKVAADSTIARLVKMVNEAQTQKSATQNFTDKLEKYYVPSVLILVVVLLFAFMVIDEPFSASFYRAMAVLVAASPCALAISTPSAVLSGVARAARGGVLVKGGKPLEDLGSLTAIAFDKTGTLTAGKPKLTGVYPLNGIAEAELLQIVVAVEKLSDHPLAAAIVKSATAKLKKEIPAASNVAAIQGRGIKASYQSTTIHIGNKELFTEKNNVLPAALKSQVEDLEKQGNTTMLVQQDDRYIGIITLMDVAREEAKEALVQLKKTGIQRVVMLTGDNQNVAEAIAKETGITEAWGNLLPEQKVAAIEKLRTSEKKVAMVGDGVNDAPAMAKSTVGIAMGAAGSDVALETADIALMADKLSNLPFAIGLSKKARGVIQQNLIISLGMVVVLIPLTSLGIAHIGPAVIGHEGSTLVVVFNALRLLGYKK